MYLATLELVVRRCSLYRDWFCSPASGGEGIVGRVGTDARTSMLVETELAEKSRWS